MPLRNVLDGLSFKMCPTAPAQNLDIRNLSIWSRPELISSRNAWREKIWSAKIQHVWYQVQGSNTCDCCSVPGIVAPRRPRLSWGSFQVRVCRTSTEVEGTALKVRVADANTMI